MSAPNDYPTPVPTHPGRPSEEVKAKVVLAGAPGVGKTSLVRRYVLNQFDDAYLQTLGAIVYKRVVDVVVGSGRTVRVTMTVWDTIGRLAASNPLHDVDLYCAQGVLAVCDVSDPGTVEPLLARLRATVRVAGDVPVHILLNKADLGLRDEVRTLGLRAGLDRGAPCYLTSAKAGDNVVAAFEDLARRIVERDLLPPTGPLDTVDRRILIACARDPLTAEEIAGKAAIPQIFAEARIERLRRQGYVQFAALGLDAAGRPQVSYGRTHKPFQAVAVAVA